MREALKKAKPMPEPKNGVRSATMTPPGDLVNFDPITRQVSRSKTAAPQAKSAINWDQGRPAEVPRSADGSVPVTQGDSAENGPAGVVPLSITPTPPGPLRIPYIGQPWMTQFRLLMRFPVAGFGDRYFLCSASSASEFHLLSAGHCVYNHDPLGDGSGRGAGFAAEIWAWAAQTDIVDPIDPLNWPDLPWGVAKMTHETTYTNWIDDTDFDWDFSFITLDRRIHTSRLAGPRLGPSGPSPPFPGSPPDPPLSPPPPPLPPRAPTPGPSLAPLPPGSRWPPLPLAGLAAGAPPLQGFPCPSQVSTPPPTATAWPPPRAPPRRPLCPPRATPPGSPRTAARRRRPVARLFSKTDARGSHRHFPVAAGDPFFFKINAYNAGYTLSRNSQRRH